MAWVRARRRSDWAVQLQTRFHGMESMRVSGMIWNGTATQWATHWHLLGERVQNVNFKHSKQKDTRDSKFEFQTDSN